MLNFTVRVVRNPTEAELQATTTAIAEAFDNEFFLDCVDGNKEYSDLVIRCHLTAAAVEGELVVAEVPDKGIVGAAVWFGPGPKCLFSEKQREQGWNDLFSKLSPESQAWWNEFLPSYNALGEKYFGPGARYAGYHLQLVGVTPEMQRKGIGRTLIKYGADQAVKAHVPAYLEAIKDTTTSMYERMGYEICGRGDLKTFGGQVFEMRFLQLHTERMTTA